MLSLQKKPTAVGPSLLLEVGFGCGQTFSPSFIPSQYFRYPFSLNSVSPDKICYFNYLPLVFNNGWASQ
jgi:hypothetical protein